MAEPPVVINSCTLEQLHQHIRREPGTLYAVLDACDEPRIPQRARLLGPHQAVCLYRGSAEQDYGALAPYLVQVDETLLNWIVTELGGTPWGIWAVAPTTLEALRRHFRRFLQVRGPDGQRWYFRFYDPRVLLSFLNSCSHGDADHVFGPVQRFALQAAAGCLMSIERAPARRTSPPAPSVTNAASTTAISATNPLHITREQLQAMQPTVLEHFMRRAVDHLTEFFPKHLELLGTEHARTLVRYGLDRCERRGISAERDVLLWLTLMVLLGSDFDTDPQYPWIETCWNDPAFSRVSARVDALYDKAMRYLDRVMGKENEHLHAALERLEAVTLSELAGPLSQGFLRRADSWVRRLWPAKAELWRPKTTQRLAKHCLLTARQYHMDNPEGKALLLGLAVFLGSGVDHDPQFPWVAGVLDEPAAESERVERLWEAAQTYNSDCKSRVPCSR